MNNKMRLALAILAIGLIIASSFMSLMALQSIATRTITKTATEYTTTTTTIIMGTKTLTRTITHTRTEYITKTLSRTVTFTRTRTKTVTSTTTTTTTVTKKVSPKAKLVYIKKELSIPKDEQREISFLGNARALIVRVESIDRCLPIVKNKYHISVYRNGEQVTTLKPDISRIDPPGDPITWEIIVPAGEASYRVVVRTEEIGCCIPPWWCNGDRVKVEILLGTYTTKFAERISKAYDKAAQLWTNPGAQFIADLIGFVGGRPELESIASMYLKTVIDLAGVAVFGTSGLSSVIDAWEIALMDASDAAEKGAMSADFPFLIYPCIREWPENIPECGTRISPLNVYELREELKNFYERVGFTGYGAGVGTPPYPPQWDYIKKQIGFMAWATSRISEALREGFLKKPNYEEALRYMQYVEEFRPHLDWIKEYSSDELALYQPWKGMYDHTRMIVIMDSIISSQP